MLWFVPAPPNSTRFALLEDDPGRNSSSSSRQYVAPTSVRTAGPAVDDLIFASIGAAAGMMRVPAGGSAALGADWMVMNAVPPFARSL